MLPMNTKQPYSYRSQNKLFVVSLFTMITGFMRNIAVNAFVSEHVTKQQQHLLSWKVPGITRSTSFKGVHKTGSPQARFNADGARSLPSTSRLKPTHETSHLHPNNLSPLTDTSRTVTGSRPNMIRLNSKQECEYGKLMGEICLRLFPTRSNMRGSRGGGGAGGNPPRWEITML